MYTLHWRDQRSGAQIHFLSDPDFLQFDFRKSDQQIFYMGSKLHLDMVWNAITIRFLQMCISLWLIVCHVARHQSHLQRDTRRCQIQRDGRASEQMSRVHVAAGSVTGSFWTFLLFLHHGAASSAYTVTDAHIITIATRADMLAMSGHTNLIWFDLIWGTNLTCLQPERGSDSGPAANEAHKSG